jgi:hypothetical protein
VDLDCRRLAVPDAFDGSVIVPRATGGAAAAAGVEGAAESTDPEGTGAFRVDGCAAAGAALFPEGLVVAVRVETAGAGELLRVVRATDFLCARAAAAFFARAREARRARATESLLAAAVADAPVRDCACTHCAGSASPIASTTAMSAGTNPRVRRCGAAVAREDIESILSHAGDVHARDARRVRAARSGSAIVRVGTGRGKLAQGFRSDTMNMS